MNESYHPDTIHQAIRKVFEGKSKPCHHAFRPWSFCIHNFRKFDKIYGTMDEKEDIFSEFYSARKKKKDEGCAYWSC